MANSRFDYFVVFAEMRTGSNLLEEHLNAFDGIECHGEAFNPSFVGHKGQSELLGITQSAREADPIALVRRMAEREGGLSGFRFFHDHDPRVLAHVLPDPRCAKIILTRNPLESYVSRKIAAQTGQWRLTDLKHARSAKVRFDPAEFKAHLEALQDFQLVLLNALQQSGQTAYYIAYEDLQDLAVINGLARYLGVEAALENLPDGLKKQNPGAVGDKVVNPEEMETALTRLDRFDLSRTPNFEPRRGPSVPSFVAGDKVALLYMPIKSGPEDRVRQWLAALNQTEADALSVGMNQKQLRQWMRRAPGHRSFTVLRHPLARAYDTFVENIVSNRFAEICATLRKAYKVPLAETDEVHDRRAHRVAFLAFLRFLKGNLAGQTGIRVDASWASQSAVLQGFAQFAVPDAVLREDRLAEGLAFLASEMGATAPALEPLPDSPDIGLAQIYDEELEEAARDAYQRDYVFLGFGDWQGPQCG